MAMVAVYAPPAFAHHPELVSNQTCVEGEVVIEYTSTSWLTTGASGSAHNNIRIQARPVGGDWVEVGNGEYTGANGYSFEGTFDGSDMDGQDFWNTTIEVRAFASGPWQNGAGGNEYSDTVEVNVTRDCFNPSCPAQYLEHKIEPVSSGTYGPNDEFTISVGSSADGPVFDWTSTVPVSQVIVKGGPGANIYDYSGAFGDSGLHAPVNPANGSFYGLSHISFCYQQIQDDPVEVSVDPGVCAVTQGLPGAVVEVTIDPDSGATMTFTNGSTTVDVVASGTVNLGPGSWSWTATAEDGYAIEGASSGQFTIDPCDVTVSVTGVCVIDGDVGSGEITVTISVDGGATVVVSDGSGPVGTLSETDTLTVPEGASYSWTASPNPGFTISGDDSGTVDIEECSPPEEPPPVVPPEVGASISVTVEGTCEVTDGVGRGEIDVSIAVADGATVTITDESGAVVGTFTSDGTLSVPEGASYNWVATPSDGFEFPVGFEPSGTIAIDGCTPDEVMASIQVTVSGTCELDGAEGEGFVDISMSVPDGATVVVRDSDGDVVGTLTDDATLSVPEGATYTWVATASEGFEFPPGFDSSGSITIERCSDPETLPFTGFDPYLMAVFAILLMGAGVAAMYFGPREEGS